MKRFFTFVLVLTTSGSVYAAPPNMIDCKDADGHYEVHYTSSSFAGLPTVYIAKNGTSVVEEPSTTEIMRQSTVFGNLVSLTAKHLEIQDAPTRVFSFLMPDVSSDRSNHANFTSQLLVGHIGGYLHPSAQKQTIKEVVALECTGSSVFF